MMAAPASSRARTAGGLLMWFAVLGGAVAWAVHLIVAWAVDELVCSTGRTQVAGVPLLAVVIASVAGPALVAAAALLASWQAWRRLGGLSGAGDRAERRAGMLALIGLWADALFLAIILAGGAALLVLSPCQR